MKNLRIEYRILGYLKRTKTLKIPTEWNELNSKQFIAATNLYLSGYTVDQFISNFFGFNKYVIRLLSSYEKYKLVELVEFVRDARVPHSSFFLSKIPGTNLISPGSRLNGMCFQQFMTVDTYFSKYLLTNKEQFLDLFISALYLKENERFVISDKDADKYDLIDIDNRYPEVGKIDKNVKYAIFLNFILIKQWLAKAYIHLFPESEETTSKAKPQIGKPVDWLEVFDMFVGDNIPDQATYQAMACTDAFRVMNRKIKEAKKHGNN